MDSAASDEKQPGCGRPALHPPSRLPDTILLLLAHGLPVDRVLQSLHELFEVLQTPGERCQLLLDRRLIAAPFGGLGPFGRRPPPTLLEDPRKPAHNRGSSCHMPPPRESAADRGGYEPRTRSANTIVAGDSPGCLPAEHSAGSRPLG